MQVSTNHPSNELGFAKPPEDTRVVVAMSGGVDSSVVAAMLKHKGYEVIGLTMQLYDHGKMVSSSKTCCAGRDIHDAKRVADDMDFPHYVLNYESFFKQQVIDDFVSSYTSGHTPIPCIRCNERVKFKELLETAKNLGADCLATGHYIRRMNGNHGLELHRAIDRSKDQSYFLFTTTMEQLDFLRFPLGDLESKEVTRNLAKQLKLPIAQKPDSQDICFVPDGDYTKLVKNYKPDALQPGEIIDLNGKVLAHHNGIANFTIGQRRRLGIDYSPNPLYVVKLDPSNHRVIVGPRNALDTHAFKLSKVNWLGNQVFGSKDCWEIMVKVRSTSNIVPAFVTPLPNNEAKIELSNPERAVAPGQACVFYHTNNTQVLGGGWISKVLSD